MRVEKKSLNRREAQGSTNFADIIKKLALKKAFRYLKFELLWDVMDQLTQQVLIKSMNRLLARRSLTER